MIKRSSGGVKGTWDTLGHGDDCRCERCREWRMEKTMRESVESGKSMEECTKPEDRVEWRITVRSTEEIFFMGTRDEADEYAEKLELEKLKKDVKAEVYIERSGKETLEKIKAMHAAGDLPERVDVQGLAFNLFGRVRTWAIREIVVALHALGYEQDPPVGYTWVRKGVAKRDANVIKDVRAWSEKNPGVDSVSAEDLCFSLFFHKFRGTVRAVGEALLSLGFERVRQPYSVEFEYVRKTEKSEDKSVTERVRRFLMITGVHEQMDAGAVCEDLFKCRDPDTVQAVGEALIELGYEHVHDQVFVYKGGPVERVFPSDRE